MSSAERGASLVEAVVAATLLGIGVVAGLVAWDSATAGAATAISRARAQCLGSGEMDAVLAAPWATAYPAPPGVHVRAEAGDPGDLQKVTVTVIDPTSDSVLYQATALKAAVLSEDGEVLDATMLRGMEAGCPS